MAWIKMNCCIMTAFYKEALVDEGERPSKEEFVYLSEFEAYREKEKLEQTGEFSEIYIDYEDEEREVWIDDCKLNSVLPKLSNDWLMDALEDEVRKLSKMSKEEWSMLINQSSYLEIKREIQRRLRELEY